MNLRYLLLIFSVITSMAFASQILSALYLNLGSLDLVDAFLHPNQNAKNLFPSNVHNWFDASLSLPPANFRAARGKALAEWKVGSSEEARKSLADYEAESPNDKSVQLFLGDIAYELGDTQDAVRIWRSLQARPLFVGRARQHLVSGKLDLAEIEMDVARLTGSDRNNPAASALLADQYADLARIYEKKNLPVEFMLNCQKAREVYATALDHTPSDYVLRIHFGTLLRDCNLPDDALAQLAEIDSRYSTTIQAWANVEIGLTHQQQSQLSTALFYYEQAVLLDPSHGGHRILLGSLYAKLGRTAEALAQFHLAAATENTNWQAWAQQAITQLDR